MKSCVVHRVGPGAVSGCRDCAKQGACLCTEDDAKEQGDAGQQMMERDAVGMMERDDAGQQLMMERYDSAQQMMALVSF